MEKENKSVFERIKENPIRSVKQFFSVIILVIVTVLMFLTGVGAPLLMVIYVAAVIVAALLNLLTIGATWWMYLLAAVIGCIVIRAVSFVLNRLLASLQQKLLVSAFGYAYDENEGGAVPASCVKPFDPTEKALNELELKYEANSITQEEYERRKAEILNKGDNN